MRLNPINMETKQIIESFWDEFLMAYWLQDCPGCSDGHSSFWRTIVLSPQWKLWQEEQNKRMKTGRLVKGVWNKSCYDMPEVEEGGIISPGHWQEFLKFIMKVK